MCPGEGHGAPPLVMLGVGVGGPCRFGCRAFVLLRVAGVCPYIYGVREYWVLNIPPGLPGIGYQMSPWVWLGRGVEVPGTGGGYKKSG